MSFVFSFIFAWILIFNPQKSDGKNPSKKILFQNFVRRFIFFVTKFTEYNFF